MLGYVARRAGTLLATLFVASVAIYGALYLAPGDPIAVLSGGRTLPAATVANLRQRYHLNEPLPIRYWHWLTDALQGNFGTSIATRENVSTIISQRAGTTLELVAYSSLLIVLFGVGLGVLAALKPGFIDTSVVIATTILAALPSFVAALVLITFFSVDNHLFPALGEGTGVAGSIYHLTLPAIALAISSLALVARITRSAVREEMRREHVDTAVSRALPARRVIRRHVLRNAAIPITTVTGLTIASQIALVSIVEQAFNLNGLGSALVQAASSKDVAVVQAISLIMVVAFVLTNTAVDVLYAILDPRVTLGSAAA